MPCRVVTLSRLEGAVRWITLTQGQETCIDETDWGLVQNFRWCAHRRMGKWYAATNVRDSKGKRRTLSLHSILFPDAPTVDHRDSDGLNNRRYNLRPATQVEQIRNRAKSVGFTSKFKGVSWHLQHSKWYAQIAHLGKKRFLGLFKDELKAARAYDAKATELFGEFAKLNFSTSI